VKIPLFLFGAIVYACVAMAEAPIVTTVIPPVGGTNIVEIPKGQAARVSTLITEQFLAVEKDGVVILRDEPGLVVEGPARFIFDRCRGCDPALLTLERWPIIDPDKVLVVPQGTGSVSVKMETSSDLLKWSSASNGVYTTQTGPKFFRMKVDR